MNDHICKRIIKETAHVVQKQIIIIFHSKLEPVEAAKTLCYTELFTIHPASSPKLPIPQSLNEISTPSQKKELLPCFRASGWDLHLFKLSDLH